jgi:hypothetical protein
MNLRMTTTAQRQQVFQSVVSGFLGRCSAVAVDVMNVQIIFAAAVLACVLVALQGRISVAAEVIVVAGFLGVLLQSLFVRGKPFVYSPNFRLALAFGAAMLRASGVLKIISALSAHQNGAYRGYATRFTQPSQVRNVFLSCVLRLAYRAHLLRCGSGLVGGAAHGASPWPYAAASLPVGGKCAGLATLHVGGGFVNHCAAVWAGKSSVFGHRNQSEFELFPL